MNQAYADVSRYALRVLIAVGIVAGLAAVVYLVWRLSQVLLVVFAAILVAVLLDGLARLVSLYTRLPKNLCLGLVVIVIVAGTLVAVILAGPAVTDQISQLSERLPAAATRLKEMLAQYPWGRVLLRRAPTPETLLPSATDILGQLSGVFGVLTNIVVILLIGLYLAISPGIYIAGLVRLLPKPARTRGHEVLGYLGHALRWWLVGRFSAMAAVGVLTTIGLEFIHMPLALGLGIIAGVLSFVPYIGPIASVVPAVLIALVEGPAMALYVVAVYSVVQFFEGNIITPVIQRRVISLPPAVLLTAQVLMGVLFGLFGILLATPLAVVVIITIQMLYVQDVLGDSVQLLGEPH
jgi:predicted PurR-regulated permease PerM